VREHDREQILALFTVEPVDDYVARAAIAVARLAGGVGAKVTHGRRTTEAGAVAPHARRIEVEECEVVVFSEEPLDEDAERAARFGVALLLQGLALARRMGDGERERVRRLEATTLGPRERELALLLAEGRTTREIAHRMQLTDATVRTYVKRILSKVGVRSRLQLLAWLESSKP
jgi:DNA-binding CsgD family transcriptional regulator